MTDHGWPDHHDDHDDPGPGPDADAGAGWEAGDDLLLPHDDPDLPGDGPSGDVPGPQWAEPRHEHDPAGDLPHPGDPGADPAAGEPGQPVGADPDAPAHTPPAEVFPPSLDVGPLPEPVDGFPWIDTARLGADGPVPAEPVPVEPVPAADLAGYAAADLPPGADPWAVLAASDDPATAALARFWRPAGDG